MDAKYWMWLIQHCLYYASEKLTLLSEQPLCRSCAGHLHCWHFYFCKAHGDDAPYSNCGDIRCLSTCCGMPHTRRGFVGRKTKFKTHSSYASSASTRTRCEGYCLRIGGSTCDMHTNSKPSQPRYIIHLLLTAGDHWYYKSHWSADQQMIKNCCWT